MRIALSTLIESTEHGYSISFMSSNGIERKAEIGRNVPEQEQRRMIGRLLLEAAGEAGWAIAVGTRGTRGTRWTRPGRPYTRRAGGAL